AAEGLPLLEPGDVRRGRRWNAASPEGFVVLQVDQHRVVERSAAEPRGELESAAPVIAADQSAYGFRELGVQRVELGLPGLLRLLCLVPHPDLTSWTTCRPSGASVAAGLSRYLYVSVRFRPSGRRYLTPERSCGE